MNIGINPRIDEKTCQYYDLFYDVLPTPDGDEKSRLLYPRHGIKKLARKRTEHAAFATKKNQKRASKK